ncbi:choline/ethanolamine kinase [Anoplophora glabripennis]|nr:choline/ethanolamine kinase [Anoplophora glabripennis]
MLNISSVKKVTGDSAEMRDLASRICRDYLNGAWKKVTAQNIGFKHISGGLSNLLYHVSLPDDLWKESRFQDEPREVLIRVYGQTHGEGALEALITESVVFTLLSERNLGPKLHGIFPGGRIEQYINARPLLTKELADEKLSVQIAQKMATIHSMQVPLHKEPTWLWNTIEKWVHKCDTKFLANAPEFAKSILDRMDLWSEIKWLRKRLESESSPVVFCHNDMQEGNILINMDQEQDQSNNNSEPNIVIIDFEYCSYNYRSFDIANHFVEWMYDYTEPNHPFYREDCSNYPTEEQRQLFIRAYLDERGSRENPNEVMKEVEVFALASHFFWAMWGLVNAETSKIPFGYWEYACSRLTCYQQLKHKFGGSGQLKRKMNDYTI